jgi:diadenosine tetraphosphate (Ap4A) HIT family hydrolase
MPINHGHVILAPVRHLTSLTMLNDCLYGEIHKIAKKIAIALLKTKDYDGFNIQYNHGECAGQDCGHAALHIIPRVGTDGFHINWRKQKAKNAHLCSELTAFLKAKITNESKP